MASEDSEDELGSALLSAWEAEEEADAAAAARRRRPRAAAAATSLSALPDPVVLRILSKLAPDDLCALSQASRAMRIAAAAPELWAAHVRQRWGGGGGGGGDDEAGAPPRDWRAAYFERDAVELREQLERGDGGAVAALLARSALAQRSEALRPAAAEALFAAGAGAGAGALPRRVAAFRRSLAAGGAGARCADGACAFVLLQNSDGTWICSACGALHVCTAEACTERAIDPHSKMPVCRATGRCYERLVADDDEGGGGGGGAVEDEGGWGGAEGGGGRLGRAFLAGWNADEGEMRRTFGVQF